MKKILSLILAGLMMTAVLASCGGERDDSAADTTTEAPVTTTAPATTTKATDNEPATNEPATNEPATNEPATNEPATNEPATNEPATNEPATNEPATNEPATNEPATNQPDTNETEVNRNLTWYDNNGDQGVFYEITVNADGATEVSYTKETYDDALANYGYAGYSWVNMAADVSEAYTGQATFVIRVQGEAGKTLLIKPFDDPNLQQTVELDGSVQTITFTLGNVSATASQHIIIFGDGGAVDASGEFTILSAYFE